LQQSPFKALASWGDLQGYSGGFGYSFGPNRLDLSYSRTEQNLIEPLFDGGIQDALIKRSQDYLTLSYSFNF
jgi:hypothetical protein